MGNVRRTVLEALALACLPASLRAAPTRADGRPDGSSAALSGVGMPYDAFDALPVRELKVPDGILRIAVASDLPAAQHAVIDRWALRSAQAIADLGFPYFSC